jgi:cell division protein ZapA
MAQVTVTINGRSYPVACSDGEEQRIGELARYVDSKVKIFARDLGQIGEARLLVLTALVLADELADAQAGTDGAAAGNGSAGKLVEEVETLAQRIEAIASRLETPHI